MQSRPHRIADSIPGDFHDPDIRWSENVKHVLTRAEFRSPDEFVSGVFRIVWQIVSTVDWNLKVDILRDFISFMTFSDPANLETLRVWNVYVSELALTVKIDLDNRPPTFTGINALQFLVDEFVGLSV